MKKKNNKPLVALLSVAFLGIVGATFAYFTSTDTFENVFKTKPYKMEVVETFESPSDWTPGTTTNKTIVATNKGDVDAAVRVSFTESWTSNNTEATALGLEDSNHNRAALINLNLGGDEEGTPATWVKSTEDGIDYYYYTKKLAPNDSSTSLINSVQFNPAVVITSTNNCVEDKDAHTKTCTTTSTGYSNATYKLTVKVETVQYDQYKDAWKTSVDIQ